jgi:hypothetical protein
MPSATPNTEVFAFSEPKIKGAEVSFAINLGVGAPLHILRATRPVWRNLYDYLRREFAPAATPSQPRPEVNHISRAERIARKERARADYEAGGITQRVAAERHGETCGAFTVWLCTTRKAERAAGKTPILKPGGRLL